MRQGFSARLQQLTVFGKFSAGAQMSMNACSGFNPDPRRRDVALDATAGGDQYAVLCQHAAPDLASNADVDCLHVTQDHTALSDVHTTAEGNGPLHASAHFKVPVAFDVANHNGTWTEYG